jgi:protein ImuB
LWGTVFTPPDPFHPIASKTMLWLALHLPALSLESVAATRSPEQAGRPLALLHDHQVQHADALALERGVRPSMKRATALALAPDLLLAAADARRDTQALRAVAHVALAFSPSVTWATPAGWAARPRSSELVRDANPVPSPALVGVRLEVQSCLRYFGGLPALLDRLRAALAPLGHSVRIASAPTALGAALLAAWRDDLALGPHTASHTTVHAAPHLAPYLAPHLAPHPVEPNSATDALQRLLDAVPLQLLGPGTAQLQALHGMGLHTLADLQTLPRAGLARRFGPDLLAAVDRARGHAPEVHAWLTLPLSFASRIELLCRADTSAQVLAGAQLLLARLLAWAGARQARIVRFSLVMHHDVRRRRDSPDAEQPPTHTTLVIAPAEPAADPRHLHSLLAERLGRLPLAAPALELSLLCDQLSAGAPPNGELFASRASERAGLAQLVDRLQARLGTAQVQCLAAVSDHRPEHSTRWQPADAARLGAPAEALAGAHRLAAQPLWLLPAPRALAERAQGPLLDGQPLQLLAGPERLESGWWDAQGPAVRDYFIAQTATGALVWVYRHRLPGGEAGQAAASGWFLQGLFA